MPRASISTKRQQGAANHRDTRHENGLVVPGKRVSRRRSQTQIDAAPRATDQNGHASSAMSAGAGMPSTATATNGSAKALPDMTNGHRVEVPRRSSLDEYSGTSSSESLHLASGVPEPIHRQIDVNATKNADVHRDSGPLEMATTVLRSLPLYDTLAILIILMQVPPVALSGIYVLFTFLTFVPPVTTQSGMNINLAEIFDWHSTMPSLVTVLCMDLFILLVWLFLWAPVQHAILDFAKPVIAVTLGGGSSAREGTSRNVSTGFLLVAAAHLFRGSKLHWGQAAQFLPPQWRIQVDPGGPLEAASSRFDKRGPHGWIKSVLAIHILTQGIVRYIREWYIKREKANASMHGLGDPEAGKPVSTSGDSAETGFATPDTDASFQQSAASSTKKKRKQSTQVRLQQPLWAALASTKIVVMKEYELTRAAEESAGTNATDIHNLGNAPFNKHARQIWICYIGCDEVCFGTSRFPDTGGKPFYVKVNSAVWQPTRIYAVDKNQNCNGDAEQANSSEDEADATSSHDRDASDAPEDSALDGEPLGTKWSGDIYGLRPLSKYVLEFVDSSNDEVIFATSIRTAPAPITKTDAVAIQPPANGQRQSRPDSPLTTMRISLAAAEAKNNEEKERLKKMRREAKTRTNGLRKENERLDNALQSAGSNDEKLRQKVQQYESQKTQAEKDSEDLDTRAHDIAETPDEIRAAVDKTEKSYRAEKEVFDAAQREFKKQKAGLDADVKTRADERQGLQTKRGKIAARIAKVDGELERIADANNRGLDEVERRRQITSSFQTETSRIECALNEQLAGSRGMNASKQEQVKALMQHLHSLQEQQLNYTSGFDAYHGTQGQPQQPQYPNPLNSSAASAYNNLNPTAMPYQAATGWPSSIAPGNSTLSTAAAQSFPAPPPGLLGTSTTWPMGMHGPWGAPPGLLKARGRSSSMLSDVSGFTESSVPEESPGQQQTVHQAHGYYPGVGGGSTLRSPPGFAYARTRQRSDGSSLGSGSGSGSAGSARDPTSPI